VAWRNVEAEASTSVGNHRPVSLETPLLKKRRRVRAYGPALSAPDRFDAPWRFPGAIVSHKFPNFAGIV